MLPGWKRPPVATMTLSVHVAKATNLPNVETFGKSDPFVIISLQGIKRKTKVIEGCLDPIWNETLVFDLEGKLPSADENVDIQVKDYERLGRNRLLGSTCMPLRNLLSGPQTMDMELNLVNKNQQPTPAMLYLKISYSVSNNQTTDNSNVSAQSKQDVSQQNTNTQAMYASTPMGELSNKLENFQLRVKIICARQLCGSNLSPACSVKLLGQVRRTPTVKTTSNPIWNRLFLLSTNTSAAQLNEDFILFEVHHSKFARSNALIGAFQMPFSILLSQATKSLINRWLVLADPNDPTSGPTGFLKVSLALLSGNQSSDFSSAKETENDDIEANLLWPPGIELRPATFTLNVFHAEDLPRMDSNFVQEIKKMLNIGKVHKELVDPYLIFSFAGKEVQTKIMYRNDHPVWKQILNLGFMFPSMCNNIKLILKDWDRLTEDDTIATANLEIPYISAAGENGFLPTYGPSFVNLYGSQREFTTLGNENDEELNSAKSEGCAYRGRMLVSLRTHLGNFPSSPTTNIEDEEVWKTEKFCGRCEFVLNAVLLEATMVKEIDKPVEFEVSIGNFGNKFESTTTPCPSSSQPTNPVFDGCLYHFLPWTEAKPFITVHSKWEDVIFRLEASNLLNFLADKLQTSWMDLKQRRESGQLFGDLAVQFISMMDQLLQDCISCLSSLEESSQSQFTKNELDVRLFMLRKSELQRIVKEAKELRNSACDLKVALHDVECYINNLRHLAQEPQNSFPDIIIWMICGKKRVAYRRIPVASVLYSSNDKASGRNCAKIQTIALKYPGSQQPYHLPVLLRLQLWFGLEKFQSEWLNNATLVEPAIFAETYENQVNVLSKWITKGPTMTRPAFSDSAGLVSLPKEKFIPPSGWQFQGDWFVHPEPSMLYDSDEGHTEFLEDIFENQNRIPGGDWIPAITPWTDMRGDPMSPRDKIVCPDGWAWDDAWKYDINRAVDEEGWEYTLEATLGGYTPVEKTYHLCRRRRWLRRRNYVSSTLVVKQKKKTDGWEYAPMFIMRFHAHERKMDLVRRRRWHRKMVSQQPGKVPVFNLSSNEAEEEDSSLIVSMSSPRMYLIYEECHEYQLRVYLYQARDLMAGDKTGLSDPYVCASFLNRSKMTEIIQQTLCPTWDQTLIFERIVLYGSPEVLVEQPPPIICEIFDHDTYGAPDFLGRTTLEPVYVVSTGSTAQLQWHHIMRNSEDGGEVLAAAELFLDDGQELPFFPPKQGELYMVPYGIRPVLQKTRIEVLCWGVRNLKTFEFSSISNPSVEIECNGQMLQTGHIKNIKANPNFQNPLMVVEMMLPKEENYLPPMNIKLRDHRSFGRVPVVGTHVIKSIYSFYRAVVNTDRLSELVMDGNTTDADAVINMDEATDAKATDQNDDIDWWSKYYASTGQFNKCKMYVEKGYEKLELYPTELENVKKFQGFHDFLTTFSFQRGKTIDDDEPETVGELKGMIRITSLPDDPTSPLPPQLVTELPSSEPEEIRIRVYIVQARDLAPKDVNSLADPYIEVTIGKEKCNSRNQFKPNTLNPVFGQMFELSAIIPIHKDLRIRVYDYDRFNRDDLIGETIIDLENRRYSHFRAMCGLPRRYYTSGPNKWRDCKRPTAILEEVCRQQDLPSPTYQGPRLVVGSKLYLLQETDPDLPMSRHLGPKKEQLALQCLHTLKLVPEHVETRRLYNPSLSGIEQGKLDMWLDFFPSSCTPDYMVDIKPRQPLKYIVRCVIYNTKDVILQEENIVGEKMSDIYVKGWLEGLNEVQKTDVHYRSLDGEGNFNWRFVFPMDYLPAEQVMVVHRKDHFWSLDHTETRITPTLHLQIWDNDKFSFDDFLGEIELNLVNLPLPSKSAKDCSLEQLQEYKPINEEDEEKENFQMKKSKSSKSVSLFEKKRVYGFWPCIDHNDGDTSLTGKIEMEIELLTEEEANLRPAGLARQDPNSNPHLPPPDRPATSFLWLTSPWKSFRFVVWNKYKWYIITAIVLLILVIFLLLFLYNIPEATISKLFGKN